MGMKVEKAGGIEIYSAQNYLKTRNNWGVGGLLLHEYSHAYHYKHCANGYDNENILEVIFFLQLFFTLQYSFACLFCTISFHNYESFYILYEFLCDEFIRVSFFYVYFLPFPIN